MRIDRDLLLKLFRYFHLLITLTSIKFTKMPPPAKLAKIFSMHGRGYQSSKKLWIDSDFEVAAHAHKPLHFA